MENKYTSIAEAFAAGKKIGFAAGKKIGFAAGFQRATQVVIDNCKRMQGMFIKPEKGGKG